MLIAVNWGAIGIGLGAVLAGVGSVLSGIAALRSARNRREEKPVQGDRRQADRRTA